MTTEKMSRKEAIDKLIEAEAGIKATYDPSIQYHLSLIREVIKGLEESPTSPTRDVLKELRERIEEMPRAGNGNVVRRDSIFAEIDDALAKEQAEGGKA